MSRLYGVCLSNAAIEVRAALPTLATYARAEVQIELGRARTNADGTLFAPEEGTALDWLAGQGVETWGYVDVWWPPNPASLGTSSLPPERDPFWLRRELIAGSDANDWWLYGKRDGKRGRVLGSYNRPCPDMTNGDFLRFALDLLLSANVRRIRFDDGFVHRHGYYRPWQAERTDLALLDGALWLYDALRAAGVQVVVNGGWEPLDPAEGLTPAQWTYPLLDHVDGVVIEYPIGFARWNTGRWFALNEEQLAGVVRFWRGRGKRVIVAAKWNGNAGIFEQHLAKWQAFAAANDCEAAVAASWNAPTVVGDKDEVEDEVEGEVEALGRRVAELERAFQQTLETLIPLAERLRALEAWRAAMKEANP